METVHFIWAVAKRKILLMNCNQFGCWLAGLVRLRLLSRSIPKKCFFVYEINVATFCKYDAPTHIHRNKKYYRSWLHICCDFIVNSIALIIWFAYFAIGILLKLECKRCTLFFLFQHNQCTASTAVASSGRIRIGTHFKCFTQYEERCCADKSAYKRQKKLSNNCILCFSLRYACEFYEDSLT